MQPTVSFRYYVMRLFIGILSEYSSLVFFIFLQKRGAHFIYACQMGSRLPSFFSSLRKTWLLLDMINMCISSAVPHRTQLCNTMIDMTFIVQSSFSVIFHNGMTEKQHLATWITNSNAEG